MKIVAKKDFVLKEKGRNYKFNKGEVYNCTLCQYTREPYRIEYNEDEIHIGDELYHYFDSIIENSVNHVIS